MSGSEAQKRIRQAEARIYVDIGVVARATTANAAAIDDWSENSETA